MMMVRNLISIPTYWTRCLPTCNSIHSAFRAILQARCSYRTTLCLCYDFNERLYVVLALPTFLSLRFTSKRYVCPAFCLYPLVQLITGDWCSLVRLGRCSALLLRIHVFHQKVVEPRIREFRRRHFTWFNCVYEGRSHLPAEYSACSCWDCLRMQREVNQVNFSRGNPLRKA